MNWLPILYALLAALTGFSAEAGPVRERPVASASAVGIAATVARMAAPDASRSHLVRIDALAVGWRMLARLRPLAVRSWGAPVPQPRHERPARRRE